MGQAKRRGTYEERKAKAIAKKEAEQKAARQETNGLDVGIIGAQRPMSSRRMAAILAAMAWV